MVPVVPNSEVHNDIHWFDATSFEMRRLQSEASVNRTLASGHCVSP